MALQIQNDTASIGEGECEGDDSKMSFEEWLMTKKISNKTIEILIDNGIDSKYIIAQCQAKDIDELNPKIEGLQRVKLLGLIAQLKDLKITNETSKGNEIKRIAVSDREEKAIQKMENKLKYIKNELSINQQTNTNILKIKQECNKSIQDFFLSIDNVLNHRKQNLMDNVSSLLSKQENKFNQRQKSLEIKQREIETLLAKCNNLLNQDINITIRKEKILELANQNILNDEEKTDNISLSNINVDFQETKQLFDTINKLGTISIDPIPIIIDLKNNNKDFMVDIKWKLSQNIQNIDKENIKLKVEWIENILLDQDQKWMEQEFDLDNLDSLENNIKVNVIKCGIYLFRIKYFNEISSKWSNYSNLKKISIMNVVLNDEWDIDNHSKSLTINGSSVIHSDNKSKRCSAYCSNIINKGTHHWRFLILKFEKISGWRQEIGVYYNNNNDNDDLIIDGYFTSKENNCYAFRFDGSLANPYKKYGIEWNQGDEIEMFLDFNEQTLSYSINNQYLGKAFDIKQGENIYYRAAVDIYRHGNAIKLLSYDHQCHP